MSMRMKLPLLRQQPLPAAAPQPAVATCMCLFAQAVSCMQSVWAVSPPDGMCTCSCYSGRLRKTTPRKPRNYRSPSPARTGPGAPSGHSRSGVNHQGLPVWGGGAAFEEMAFEIPPRGPLRRYIQARESGGGPAHPTAPSDRRSASGCGRGLRRPSLAATNELRRSAAAGPWGENPLER